MYWISHVTNDTLERIIINDSAAKELIVVCFGLLSNYNV